MQQLQEEIVVSTRDPIDPEAFGALRPQIKRMFSQYGQVAISLWFDSDNDTYFIRFRFETEERALDVWRTGDCLTATEEIAPGALILPSNHPLPDHLQNLVPEEE